MDTLEAVVKIRDGKKWKKRFCVLQSPTTTDGSVADVALLEIHSSVKFTRKPGLKRRVLRIDGFYGLESGFSLDKESRTLAVLCHSSTTIIAFDSDTSLRSWELWLRRLFGHGCQYSVHVVDAPASLVSIRNGNARLHLRDGMFCLSVDSPPRVAVGLTFREIRRYGAFENKFCVEAGSRTGSLAGMYVFRTGHRDQLAFMFRLAAEGGLHKYLSSSTPSTETERQFDRVSGQNTSSVAVMYGSLTEAGLDQGMDRPESAVVCPSEAGDTGDGHARGGQGGENSASSHHHLQMEPKSDPVERTPSSAPADHYYNLTGALAAACINEGGSSVVGGYTPMMPGGTVYERMEQVGSTLVKAFEPVIVRRERSVPLPESDPKLLGRKLSLPESSIRKRSVHVDEYKRRFSLEERPVNSALSVLGGSGNAVSTLVRSTGALARGLFPTGSMKAKATSFFTTLAQRSSNRHETKSSCDGRQSRTYSEPPTDAENAIGPQQGQQPSSGSTSSSLDLDEVIYDVSSVACVEHVPPSVLRKLGFKPLVTAGPSEASSSNVKLPICPKQSYGTESTRSSESINQFPFDDTVALDSLSVDSDESHTDGVFPQAMSTKRTEGSYVADRKGTVTTERGSGQHGASSVVTLAPVRLSESAKRRLRLEVTKPLSGSYSRYDGDASSESAVFPPAALTPPNRNPSTSSPVTPKQSMPRLDQHHQAYSRFEIGGVVWKNKDKEKTKETNVGRQWREIKSAPAPAATPAPAPVLEHSPPPPAEPAPAPPREERGRIGTPVTMRLPLSALPRLEGHVFKFPPSVLLNYATLAGQNGSGPSTPSTGAVGTSGNSAWKSPVSSGTVKQGNSVEYARIDQAATQAARKVVISRREETRIRWSSSHALFSDSESSVVSRQSHTRRVSTSSSLRRRLPFSLKGSLIRRRTSVASLAGI